MMMRKTLLLIFSAAAACTSSKAKPIACQDVERSMHPNLCSAIDMSVDDLSGLATKFGEWALENDLLLNVTFNRSSAEKLESRKLSSLPLPVVFAHGVGDSCFNDGMIRITKHVSSLLNVYAKCIPTGKNLHEDIVNGYLLNMNGNVDVFAEKVRANPELAKGFNAIGFSQGCNVIRGYIARYNDPPVHTFISINGVNAGVAATPNCIPEQSPFSETGTICDLIREQLSHRAYTELAQKHSFQANYWRDPSKSQQEAYRKYSQLAQWNNEGYSFNSTLRDNFGITQKFVWVLAEHDEIVWPRAGEQWGAPDSNAADPFHTILPMRDTEWYINDLFGLKTADEEGKHNFESFNGKHIHFQPEEFDDWVFKYLT